MVEALWCRFFPVQDSSLILTCSKDQKWPEHRWPLLVRKCYGADLSCSDSYHTLRLKVPLKDKFKPRDNYFLICIEFGTWHVTRRSVKVRSKAMDKTMRDGSLYAYRFHGITAFCSARLCAIKCSKYCRRNITKALQDTAAASWATLTSNPQ